MTNDTPARSRFHRALIGTLIMAAILLAGGTALSWAWNTLAVDLAHAPRVQFRHALAFEVALAAMALLTAASMRLASRRHAAREHPAAR
jgi:hypothetical protein